MSYNIRKIEITHTNYLFQILISDVIYDEQLVLDMITVHCVWYKPCHITITKTDSIDEDHFLEYNSQSLTNIDIINKDRF